METIARTAFATAEELAAIAQVLGTDPAGAGASDKAAATSPGAGRIRRRGASRRTLLLPALNALKDRVGWISPGAVEELSEQLLVPRADIYGVATFYALLPTTEQPPKAVHVCTNLACRLQGGPDLLTQAQDRFDPAEVVVHASPCLGQCELAPAAFVEVAGEEPVRRAVAPAEVGELAEVLAEPAADFPAVPTQAAFSLGKPVLLRRIMELTPTTLEGYLAAEGYHALRLALEHGPQWALDELERSQLRGRGGAAFPTTVKWRAVAQAPEGVERYIVANADESEPGTFKDRVLLEGDPFALIEAMTIAGYVCGANQGYVYLRSEYPAAWQALQQAKAEAEAAGWLGSNIADSGFAFELELRRGAGAYICGEETALFNSLEGYRGEPRNKPPFPTESGLFNRPTLVNNVETLANILPILINGGEAFAQVGTAESTGTRLFCLSGDCGQPGVYEVPLGIPLAELFAMAKTVAGSSVGAVGSEAGAEPLLLADSTDPDRASELLLLGAAANSASATDPRVLLGGAAGSFVPPHQRTLPLSFEAAAKAGLTLGSGAVIVIPPTADLPDLLANIAEFFAAESCGQCVPCRVGTVRQVEALERLGAAGSQPRAAGRSSRSSPQNSRSPAASELQVLADLDAVMTDASICGLGQTAAAAVRSAIKLNLLETAT